MKFLEPWWSTEKMDESFHQRFSSQLKLECPKDHPLYDVSVNLIARGNGDDALFKFDDRSGRIAQVHLTWSKSEEKLPYPVASVFANIDEWVKQRMIPENAECRMGRGIGAVAGITRCARSPQSAALVRQAKLDASSRVKVPVG